MLNVPKNRQVGFEKETIKTTFMLATAFLLFEIEKSPNLEQTIFP